MNKQAVAFLVNTIDQAQNSLESKAIDLLKISHRFLGKKYVAKARTIARQAGLLAELDKQFQTSKKQIFAEQIFAYKKASICGPLNGVANFLKGVAHLGCEPITASKEIGKGIGTILNKIVDLQAAADYLDTNPAKATEIYDPRNLMKQLVLI